MELRLMTISTEGLVAMLSLALKGSNTMNKRCSPMMRQLRPQNRRLLARPADTASHLRQLCALLPQRAINQAIDTSSGRSLGMQILKEQVALPVSALTQVTPRSKPDIGSLQATRMPACSWKSACQWSYSDPWWWFTAVRGLALSKPSSCPECIKVLSVWSQRPYLPKGWFL